MNWKVLFGSALVTAVLGAGVFAFILWFTDEEPEVLPVFYVYNPVYAHGYEPYPEPMVYPEDGERGNDPEEENYYPEYEYYPEDEYPPVCPYTITILLSAGGDVTLGGDRRWRGYHRFMEEWNLSGHDHAHFFKNVADIFYESDLAIVNLEGALTYRTYPHMDKEFVFRADPHFAWVLHYGNVDVVTIANNHTQDFFRAGYYDTLEALREAGIKYFGNEFYLVKYVNGVRIGLFGHRIWNDSAENRRLVHNAIEYLRRQNVALIIAYYHWGVEQSNHPVPYQVSFGRYSIRAGADLVLGAHPHVIQGWEEYRGRYIVYSLANFSFGGNANPRCQDSFIFQQEFTFYRGVWDGEINVNIIPIFVSSIRTTNDFVPTPAEGADAERIMGRLLRYSAAIGNLY